MNDDDLSPERPGQSGALIRPFLRGGYASTAGADDPPDGVVAEPGLRPFLLTAGRVPAEGAIAVETQVVATQPDPTGSAPAAPGLAFERRRIVELCAQPLSVAELSARLGLHLGVIRVLVGDLSAEGHLAVYLPNADASADVDTLLRVIRGLRAIK